MSHGRDANDRRRAVITVTEAGRKMTADRRSESVQRMAAAMEEEFSPAERRELLAMPTLRDRHDKAGSDRSADSTKGRQPWRKAPST
ncbi:hypothetical protein ACFV98_29590 [Streptomyces violascens]|uniref:hypothetical protein n=1 Tax=Streptomyces violascens TaxID=67381 RepID=UPI0036596870